MTLTDLLLRDPEHPEVRALLELRYRQVCAEQALLAKVLKLPEKPGPPIHATLVSATIRVHRASDDP